ncbi:hypothetical protein SLEP1_g57093 [Rubroshorea leprosula]|uniref:Uncharacterized protein n=1 Tax=Rubroshorea leprosula TaxID=152421 RepID=A0AAV5MLI0_9ROSI|nr:hypothetical protein SLEP1_g57093 [Rubroshorea leprosula]
MQILEKADRTTMCILITGFVATGDPSCLNSSSNLHSQKPFERFLDRTFLTQDYFMLDGFGMLSYLNYKCTAKLSYKDV